MTLIPRELSVSLDTGQRAAASHLGDLGTTPAPRTAVESTFPLPLGLGRAQLRSPQNTLLRTVGPWAWADSTPAGSVGQRSHSEHVLGQERVDTHL